MKQAFGSTVNPMNSCAVAIDAVHDGNHHPDAGDSELWQESMMVHWYDPIARVGSYQHLSLLRPRSMADANSVITVDGEVVGRYQNLELPLPDADLTELTLGPMRVRSLAPLIRHAVCVTHESVGADIELNAFLGPCWMNFQDSKNHWESFGRATGSVRMKDRELPVAGYFYLNRSWGNRDYSRMLSYRIATAIFDRDLIFRLIQVTRPDGYSEHGYVVDGGQILSIGRIESEFRMASDGVTARGADLTVWTTSGAAYRLQGRAVDADVMTQRNGFMYSISNGVFEFGGRLGTGFLMVAELKQPTPQHRIQLGSPR